MELAEAYISNVDSNPQKASVVATDAAFAISSDQTSLIAVVQSVGNFINHEDATIRSKAVRFLSATLAKLKHDFLSRQEVVVLTEFFTARVLENGALPALECLQGMSRTTRDSVLMTFEAIAENYTDMQSLPQSRRFEVYNLINALMRDHRKYLMDMGNGYIDALIGIVASEKDPRNLMIVFSILYAVMVEWNISQFVEPLFDSVFCYFPITFRPPPGDPHKITAQDLKERLRDCIASNFLFAPFAFPQLLEKLDSTSANVKKDVIMTIQACVISYGPACIAKFSKTLWESLKFEVTADQDNDVSVETLNAISLVAVQLSTLEKIHNSVDALQVFLRPLILEAKQQLDEPHQRQTQVTASILAAAAKSSAKAFSIICKDLLPVIIGKYHHNSSIAARKGILEVLDNLLGAGIEAQKEIALPELGDALASSTHKDELVSLLGSALMGSSKDEIAFRVLALKCLRRCCFYTQIFSDNEIGLNVQYFDELLFDHGADNNQALKEGAIDALREISRHRPALILEITLPYLLSKIPDSIIEPNDTVTNALDVIARIGTSENLVSTVSRRLFSRFESANLNPSCRLLTKAYLLTLARVLSGLEGNLRAQYFARIKLLIQNTAEAAQGRRQPTCLNDAAEMILFGVLVSKIVQASSLEDQSSLGPEIYKLFTDSALSIDPIKQIKAPHLHRLTIFLSTSLLAGITSKIILPTIGYERHTLANCIVDAAQSEPDVLIRHGLNQHICLLLNKFFSKAELNQVQIVRLLQGESDHKYSLSDTNIVPTIFWAAKALIYRLESVDGVTSTLLSLLNNHNVGGISARAFSMLLADDMTLTRDNGATIRLLARQKVLSIAVPRLVTIFRNASEDIKTNCLVALSGIIAGAQAQASSLDIEMVLPLLLRSLDLDQPTIKSATLLTIQSILLENSSAVEGHLTSLITRLQKVIQDNTLDDTEQSKLLALKCLRGLAETLDQTKLVACRNQVVAILKTALDDPRRHVRKEAVDCLHVWLKLEAIET